MVNADDSDAEGFSGRQRAQAGWARRADDDFGEAALLEIVENLKHGREAQALQFILGKLELSNGGKIFQRHTMVSDLGAAGDDRDIVPRGDAGGSHLTDRSRDTVHIFQGVREPSATRVFKVRRSFPTQGKSGLSEPLAARKTEGVNVGAQQSDNRGEWNDRLDALQKFPSRDLMDEFRDKTIAEFAGDEVRHKEGASFRCPHSRGFTGHGGLEVRMVERLRKLFPKRDIPAFRQIENFSSDDALSQKSKLVHGGELSGIFTFHEAGGDFFQQTHRRITGF